MTSSIIYSNYLPTKQGVTMCSKEIWRKALNYREIRDETAKELKILKESKTIDKVIDKIISKNNFQTRNIKLKRKIFKHSIISHIKWMIDNINKGEVDFSPYEEFTLKEEHYAYCLFYTYLSKDGDIKNNQHEEISNLLIEYFKFLSKHYCD
jgi:hypothetical protein